MRVRSTRQAASYIARAGIVLVFPKNDSPLPSLWEAAFNTTEVKVFTVGERGKRVLSGELGFVWTLMNRLATERAACLGKYVSARLALIAPDLISSLYAQTRRAGTEDDFRQSGLLSPLELELAEALLQRGPLTAPDLRNILGGRNARATKSALVSLERQLIVTHAGEQERRAGWDAAVYDLLARRYADELATVPPVTEARAILAGRLLESAGRLSARELATVLALPRREAATVLDGLVLDGRAEVEQSGDPAKSTEPGVAMAVHRAATRRTPQLRQ